MQVDYSHLKIDKPGKVALKDFASDHNGGLNKDQAKHLLKKNQKALRVLQERLFAESRQSLLVVLQAMDTGGKDSTIEKVAGHLNPQGCYVRGFKKPTDEELGHDFLWRVHQHTPRAGMIGIFNRSHYEDVLVVRVHQLASKTVIEQRYDHINEFEQLLAENGTRIIKIMLNISKDYQLSRLRNRLEEPEKHWKFNPGDLKERKLWSKYMQAYERALSKCSMPYAPWFVIPAETRWYRDVVISQILLDAMKEMNPRFPPPDFDIDDYPPDSLT